MGESTPYIASLDRLMKENPLHSKEQLLHWIVAQLCDVNVHVEPEPNRLDIRKVPEGFVVIEDAEMDVVAIVPKEKAELLARLINEAG